MKFKTAKKIRELSKNRKEQNKLEDYNNIMKDLADLIEIHMTAGSLKTIILPPLVIDELVRLGYKVMRSRSENFCTVSWEE